SVCSSPPVIALDSQGESLTGFVQQSHPTTKRREWRTSRDEIAAFEASYTTPTLLSAETGAHLNTIQAVLQCEGVQPFRPNGLDVGPVYLRNAVEPVVAFLKSQEGKQPLAMGYAEIPFHPSVLEETFDTAAQAS
ncbi:hypothetical protein Q4543_03255, partial [Salipiger sp. 1_MG-2023]|nr:hypothetical protein [Salipiger sp. 1_MG-2023]